MKDRIIAELKKPKVKAALITLALALAGLVSEDARAIVAKFIEAIG